MKNLFFLACILCCVPLLSQRLNTPSLSTFTNISQDVGLTEIALEYSRPSARERKVFGDLVPYGKIWRTGANASTKLSFADAIRIGGKPIMAGTYALYTIPGKEKWTIIIHGNTTHRSIAGDAYKQAEDVFRFESKPIHSPNFVETFTIQFADITTSSCHLQISWEHTVVNIPIETEVDKKIEAQMQEFLKDPASIPDRTYFEAAQYYLTNDKDLVMALAWIDAALTKSPENFRYGLLKSKIQAKSGDKKAALITINQAHTWAMNAKNDNYIEQTDLYRKSLLKN